MAKKEKEKELEEMSMDEFAEARNGKSCQRLESISIEPAQNGFVMEVRRRPEKKAKKGNDICEYKPPERMVFESAETLLVRIKKELED